MIVLEKKGLNASIIPASNMYLGFLSVYTFFYSYLYYLIYMYLSIYICTQYILFFDIYGRNTFIVLIRDLFLKVAFAVPLTAFPALA